MGNSIDYYFRGVDDLMSRVERHLGSAGKFLLSDRLEFREDSANFVLEIALPGFKKEEVKLTAKDGYIQIKAERKTGSKSTVDMSVPIEGDVNSAKAKLEDGLLTITVPKTSRFDGKEIIID